MKVLVFGGTGAIGTPVVQLLIEHGHEVYVTSRRKRESKNSRLHYICGNAMDLIFLQSILGDNRYDVLIDFMAYTTDQFHQRYEYLLNHVGKLFYFSSSRVYADADLKLITEESPRLLDICKDADYLATDEYALQKARQENMLFESKQDNWTIIRPYVTYNTERLQLGVLEKEEWLYRAIRGRSIVFTRDIADRITSLTYGLDVAERIVKLAETDDVSNGQVYHIATEEKITWNEILLLYVEILTEILGRPQKYKVLSNSKRYAKYNRYWQIKYDRLYNRVFDSSKIQSVTGNMEFTQIKEGLKKSLTEFLQGERKFKTQDINWLSQGFFDKVCHEKTSLSEIPGGKNKVKYLMARYTNLQEFRNKF